jgi:hypothetical protein
MHASRRKLPWSAIKLVRVVAPTEVRPLSRLRGRVGVGVFPQNALTKGIDFPHPPRAGERVDLPRKRER